MSTNAETPVTSGAAPSSGSVPPGPPTPRPSSDDVRTAVRSRYARLAGAAGTHAAPDDVAEDQGCCGPSCCGTGTDASEVSRSVGYGDDDLSSAPADANLGLGCGNPVALASLRPGETVLDLGSGGGLDCFLAAEKVGPEGKVIGVDMTPEMIALARRNARKGGHDNVEFRLGEIEALPVADASVDVVISNCVLNLSPERPRVLAEALRALRPGGRLMVSDLVSDTPIPAFLEGDLDAVAACLPTPRDVYLQAFRDAGFDEVDVAEERDYPASALLDDPRVTEVLEAADEPGRDELEAFARSIRSVAIQARKGG